MSGVLSNIGEMYCKQYIQDVFGDLCTRIEWNKEHSVFIVVKDDATKDGVPCPASVAVSLNEKNLINAAGSESVDVFKCRVRGAYDTLLCGLRDWGDSKTGFVRYGSAQ